MNNRFDKPTKSGVLIYIESEDQEMPQQITQITRLNSRYCNRPDSGAFSDSKYKLRE